MDDILERGKKAEKEIKEILKKYNLKRTAVLENLEYKITERFYDEKDKIKKGEFTE